MNPTIMRLANRLVYKNQMMVGKDSQEDNYLYLPPESVSLNMASLPSSKVPWIKLALSEQVEHTIIFLDTSLLKAAEEKVGESIRNPQEADIVKACVNSLVQCGCDGSEIGIIAPYRGQVAYVRQMVKGMGDAFASVEINTVDQYQGRDKDVIVCSFTKSKIRSGNCNASDAEAKGGILEDLRRLNVAITRAKKKLILIGNRETLKNFAPFERLFNCMDQIQFFAME